MVRGETLKSPSIRDEEISGLKQYAIYCILNFLGLSPSKFILRLQKFTIKLKNNVIRTKILDKSSKVLKIILIFLKTKKQH